MPSCGCYRFSRFELDLVRGCLREGDREIKLRPKTFGVLRHLVEQAGRLLSKDELMAAAWPGIHVSDGSLVQCIREIRRALDDDDQGCVKSVPGRGYLLAAPVTSVLVAPAPPTGAPPPRPLRRADLRTIARVHGRVGAGVAVALCLGAAIGALTVRWLDGVPTAAPSSPLSVAARADDPQTELAYWQTVQASRDPRDVQSYLDQYPSGAFAALARNRLRALEASGRAQARQLADDARHAVAAQRQTQVEAARHRAEVDRVAALETEVKRLSAAAVVPAQSSQARVPQAAPPPTAAPELGHAALPRAALDGKWAGELGFWRFAFTVKGGEIRGLLSCGNNIYRVRAAFGVGHALDITANRAITGGGFPTTIGLKGDFPTLRLQPINMLLPGTCNSSEPFELRPVSAG